jgi:hypothetical protein
MSMCRAIVCQSMGTCCLHRWVGGWMGGMCACRAMLRELAVDVSSNSLPVNGYLLSPQVGVLSVHACKT